MFTAAVCVSAPIFGRFIPAFITFITNKRLNKEGTMIASINTAEKISSSNAVVLKGGKEAKNTNTAIFNVINDTLKSVENF